MRWKREPHPSAFPSFLKPWPQSLEVADNYATKYGFIDDRGVMCASQANDGLKGDF